jgi:Na+-translocating ferredoxin:NAD+ oxidoreductase subunit G
MIPSPTVKLCPSLAARVTRLLSFPMKDGKVHAVAMEASGKGYGGDVNVMVGFDVKKDNLLGISVTTHKETPGLGSRIQEPAFTKQFKGQGPGQGNHQKDGGEIDVISGATFSSIGSADAVKQASGWYAALKDTIKTTW